MQCPYCQSTSISVYETRHEFDTIKRLRRCMQCDHRWRTYEEIDKEYQVRKRKHVRTKRKPLFI